MNTLAHFADETLMLDYTKLRDRRHTILVRSFLLGQYRIQITAKDRPAADAPDGHGEIVQELCTYRFGTLVDALAELRSAGDAVARARSWARPWNCEGGRIRLDNQPRRKGE